MVREINVNKDQFVYVLLSASNQDVSAPTGCVNERLNKDHPLSLTHEELPTSLNKGEDGKPIPFQLAVHLEKIKKQYLSFIRHMQVNVNKIPNHQSVCLLFLAVGSHV